MSSSAGPRLTHSCKQSFRFVLQIILLFIPIIVFSQDTSPLPIPSPAELYEQQVLTQKLAEVSEALDQKIRQRDEVASQIASGDEKTASEELRQRLTELNQDITTMRATFELIALEKIDIKSVVEGKLDYDWRDELVEIVAPVLDSLKSITKKPREISELRESISLNEKRIQVADEAVAAIDVLLVSDVDTTTTLKLQGLSDKWKAEKQTRAQSLLISRAQLERIEENGGPVFVNLWPSIKSFIAGRGLTLLLASAAALSVWFFLRFLWWVVNKRLVSKQVRRGNLWYRLASYSSYLFTILLAVMAVVFVLYLRQDLLLLALALVGLAVTAVGLRNFIPRYLREARLLLNIGPVREDERVMFRGLPWQVMSLNIETVLRNPALAGVLRLPLSTVEGLVSRPVKDQEWFPSAPGDRVFLPDGSFATVTSQTPDLVTLSVRGGMTKTCPSSEFYAMQITNISGGENFGVAVTFGLDYSLQNIALTEIPEKLKSAISQAVETKGFSETVTDIMVELNGAGASSMDYLIYLTVKPDAAGSYYGLKRLVLHACIEEANKNAWTIPFPQMTLHQSSVADPILD